MNHHSNTEVCPKCEELFAKYPGFAGDLRTWFSDLRKRCPEAHISCAGRGAADQNDCLRRGVSRAHWGQSAHNYNAAVDIFVMAGKSATWPTDWFIRNVGQRLTPRLKWYGEPGSSYYELPHVEVADWRDQAAKGNFRLVE